MNADVSWVYFLQSGQVNRDAFLVLLMTKSTVASFMEEKLILDVSGWLELYDSTSRRIHQQQELALEISGKLIAGIVA